jgi:hypothetical protein
LGGLGILCVEKFAKALRLRWLWLQWKDPKKIWMGMGNPGTSTDMNLFYAATQITVKMGQRSLFVLGVMERSPRIFPLDLHELQEKELECEVRLA